MQHCRVSREFIRLFVAPHEAAARGLGPMPSQAPAIDRRRRRARRGARKVRFCPRDDTRNGKIYRLKARSVILAGGAWITKHVVSDLPSTHRDAYNQFHYSAHLVANVALRNWRFLHKLGLSGGRWFDGFGYWTEVRTTATFGSDSRTIGPDSPTVLTLVVPLFYPGLPTAAIARTSDLQAGGLFLLHPNPHCPLAILEDVLEILRLRRGMSIDAVETLGVTAGRGAARS